MKRSHFTSEQITRDKDFLADADDFIIATLPESIEIAIAKPNKPNS